MFIILINYISIIDSSDWWSTNPWCFKPLPPISPPKWPDGCPRQCSRPPPGSLMVKVCCNEAQKYEKKTSGESRRPTSGSKRENRTSPIGYLDNRGKTCGNIMWKLFFRNCWHSLTYIPCPWNFIWVNHMMQAMQTSWKSLQQSHGRIRRNPSIPAACLQLAAP